MTMAAAESHGGAARLIPAAALGSLACSPWLLGAVVAAAVAGVGAQRLGRDRRSRRRRRDLAERRAVRHSVRRTAAAAAAARSDDPSQPVVTVPQLSA